MKRCLPTARRPGPGPAAHGPASPRRPARTPGWPPPFAVVALTLVASAGLGRCRPAAAPAAPTLLVADIVTDVEPVWGEAAGVTLRGPDTGPLDASRLRQQMRSVLRHDASVRLDASGPAAQTVAVAVRMMPAGPTLEVRLEGDDAAGGQAAEVLLAATGADPGAALRAAMVAAWARLGDLRRLQGSTPEDLIAAVEHPDPRVSARAVELLARRHDRGAVASICARLRREPDPEGVLRGMGALVTLGDPQAVPTLIDLTLHQEPPFLVQSAFAIGALGGRLAEAYLVTLASGHPDPQVAVAAREALGGAAGGDPDPAAAR